jgi:DNA-binding NarL/FixJ family response regulator
VVASDFSELLAITTLLRGIAITNPHICRHPDDLHPILARQPLTIVIASASDLDGCSDYCIVHNLPILVVVHHGAEAAHVLALHDQYSQAYSLNLVWLNGDQTAERLQTALQTIQQGGIYRDPHLRLALQVPVTEYATTILETTFPNISPRLREVLALAALGSTTPEIARSMQVTEATVHKYWMRLCAATQASRSTLIGRATMALLHHAHADAFSAPDDAEMS